MCTVPELQSMHLETGNQSIGPLGARNSWNFGRLSDQPSTQRPRTRKPLRCVKDLLTYFWGELAAIGAFQRNTRPRISTDFTNYDGKCMGRPPARKCIRIIRGICGCFLSTIGKELLDAFRLANGPIGAYKGLVRQLTDYVSSNKQRQSKGNDSSNQIPMTIPSKAQL